MGCLRRRHRWPVLAKTVARLGRDTRDIPLAVKGDGDLLARHEFVAFFCSVRCPGDLILKTYDLARALRDDGVPIIGGFQTPMERDCLRLLLRGRQPVVVCPARSIIRMRVPREWRSPIDDGRLLIVSPFEERYRRPTKKLALERNRLVVAIAERVFIAYAEPGGSTESVAREAANSGKPLLTIKDEANENLVRLGAKEIDPAIPYSEW